MEHDSLDFTGVGHRADTTNFYGEV